MNEFIGFSSNKKNLYSEMKIFITKKGANFGIRPIVSNILPSVQEESIPMMTSFPMTNDYFNFYTDLKRLKQTFNTKLNSTKTKISSRLKMTFDSKGAQDEEIQNSLGACYQLIKTFESKIRDHTQTCSSNLLIGSNVERFDKGICSHLNTEFSKMIKHLKKEEQKFFSGVRTKKTDDNSSYFDFIHDNHISDDKRVVYNEKGDKMVLTEINRMNQSEDLNKMLDQINSLTDLLAQMNDLVVEQGTVVDRIDMNLEASLERTKKGNKELLSAKEELEKGCAAKLMRILIIANIVVFLLLMLKLK